MRRFLAGPFLRLVPVGLVALAVQRVVFAQHPVAGVKLQVVLALVVAAGAAGGTDRGAVAGFALGVMYDAVGDTPLGLIALAYGIGGMTAGSLHRFTPDPQWWLAAIFATLGAAVGEASIPLIDAISGQRTYFSTETAWAVAVVAVSSGLMCPVLMPVGRWMMGVKRKKWKAIAE